METEMQKTDILLVVVMVAVMFAANLSYLVV